MVVSCVTSWGEKRWVLKQNPALGEKTEFSSCFIEKTEFSNDDECFHHSSSFVDERLSRPSQNIVFKCFKDRF